MTIKEWIFSKNETGEKSLIKRLLASRGISSDKDMYEFTHPLEMELIHPRMFLDMDKAVERISAAISSNEKIVIYGDFDADGVTSTSLLYKTLTYLGANVSYFIPDREKEGHGFDTKALVKLMTSLKPKLIISVDCGISDVEPVNFIKSFKIDVIITDHHEAPDVVPEALAIINPKAPNALDEYLSAKQIKSLTSLAGVGVAFKLAQALLEHYEKLEYIPEILPFVAVGTVADVVPLIGENRYFVTKGLDLISQGKHYGLKRLLEQAGYSLEKGITAETIAFGVAPRINASGRLDTVEEAIKVLISENPAEIEMAISNLNEFNKIRQTLCQEVFAQADEMVKKDGNRNPAIVLFNSKWHVGIIGIVASKLVEKYYKPTFLMTYSEETKQIKCSARSIEGVHLYEVINSIGDILDGYGGHSLAAGLSFSPEKTPFKSVKEQLNRAVKEATNGKELKPFLNIDLELSPDDVSVNLVNDLSILEPYGASNPSPVFALKNCTLKQKRLMGENKNHLRMIVECENKEFTCVRWQAGDIALNSGDNLDIAFHPQINEFQGNVSVQLVIDDVHSPMLKDEEKDTVKLKIYDHRKKTDILPQVEDYVKNSKLNIKVFAENKQICDMLSPYKALYQNVCNRENLQHCDALMFFDYPADKESFEYVLQETSPQSIHLMNYNIKYFNDKEFLKTINGMLRFACNNNNGKVELLRCASFLGKSLELIKTFLDLLEECSVIEICERNDKYFVIKRTENSDISLVLHNPKYEEILNLAEDCELFQKSILEDNIDDIDNLCALIL